MKTKNRIISLIVFWLIYGALFILAEHFITMSTPGIHIMDVSLDEKIPFIEHFIYPYLLWFPFIVAVNLTMPFVSTAREFKQFFGLLLVSIGVLCFYFIYPNAQTLRPEGIPDNISGMLIARIEKTDNPANVFPSLHVYISFLLAATVCNTEWFRQFKWCAPVSIAIAAVISASTVFVKQHSITDVFGGLILSVIAILVIVVIPNIINKATNKSSDDFEEAE